MRVCFSAENSSSVYWALDFSLFSPAPTPQFCQAIVWIGCLWEPFKFTITFLHFSASRLLILSVCSVHPSLTQHPKVTTDGGNHPYHGSDHITSLCGLPATDITDPYSSSNTPQTWLHCLVFMLTGPGEIWTNAYLLKIKQQWKTK